MGSIMIVKPSDNKAKALKGLTLRQRKFVANLGNAKSVNDAARKAGYAEVVVRSRSYKFIQNPKIRKSIQLYYQHGEADFLSDIATGRITDTILDEKADTSSQLQASKLALMMSGKLKQVNVNYQMLCSRDEIINQLKELFE